MINKLKKIIRQFYYFLNQGKITHMHGNNSALNKLWIIDKKYGRAYYKGYYEPALTTYIDRFLNADSVFLDIGSHAGYFSLVAASRAIKGHIYSFEPDPDNCAFITQIKSLNKINNWTIENKGIAEISGHLKFKTGPSSSTGMIAEDGNFLVPVVSVDEYFANTTVSHINLIKIDVEGYGGKVMEGAIKTIRKFLPVILLENHLGSNELSVVWNLLRDEYIFSDFNRQRIITELPKFQIDFVLMEPKLSIQGSSN